MPGAPVDPRVAAGMFPAAAAREIVDPGGGNLAGAPRATAPDGSPVR